jgi:hypothetical protein
MPPATLDVNSLISMGEAGDTGAVTNEAAQSLRKWVDHAYQVTN